MKKFLMIAVIAGLVGCGGSKPATTAKAEPQATKAAAAVSTVPSSGFVRTGDNLTFMMAPVNLRAITDDSAGKMLDLKALKVETVSVAGAFNNWDIAATPLQRKGAIWKSAPIPASKMGTQISQFKFVVNGKYWVEPAAGATNTIDNGMKTGGRNYVFEP